jgi:hypothetical protein
MMLNAIGFCSFVLASGVDRSSCIRAADEVISATPSNLQEPVTGWRFEYRIYFFSLFQVFPSV